MKNSLIQFLISVVVSIPILFYVIPFIVELNDALATFVALALGIWTSGYVFYTMIMFLSDVTFGIDNDNS